MPTSSTDSACLYRTEARERFGTVRADRVRETGTGVFVEAESRWRPWFRSILGLRGDGYTFHVNSDRTENSGTRAAGIVSPKVSVVFTPWRDAELYLSGGYGFHSNDARGTTITDFYRPASSLVFDADVSFARARLRDVTTEENHIPGTIENVFAGGIAWAPERGPFGALRLRHLGAYPLTEDNRVRADPTTLLNADAGYPFRSRVRLKATVLNLLDSRASDVQYFYASGLRGGPADGVEDVHFHPVEPRQLRVSLRWSF